MRRYHALPYVCVVLAIFLVCDGRAAADAVRAPQLIGASPLSAIEGVSLGQPVKAQQETVIHFTLSESDIQVLAAPGGWSTVLIAGCSVVGSPGEPQLPMKTITRDLPLGAEVLSVSVVSGAVRTLSERLRVSPAPEPAFWPLEGAVGKRMEDPSVYQCASPFPSTLLKHYVGSDGHVTRLTVQFSPVLFYPTEDRILVVTEAEIRVDYSVGLDVGEQSGDQDSCRCVIVAPDDMAESAAELASIHEDNEGIETDVVLLSWISSNYDEAEDSTYDGYAYGSTLLPINYDYALAKKIVSFLRDTDAHPSLEYVTILGSAANVPPSYYYHDADSGLGHDQDWMPSDFLYASPDYDLVPNFKVGRLPARDTEDADIILSKLRGFSQQADWSWFSNVMLAGSRPFRTPYYYGELMSVDMINQGYFDGMNITKAFGTDRRYSAPLVMEALSNGGYGFVYNGGHGSGSAIYFDDGMIGSWNLLATTHSGWQLPIFVSMACICGQFDTTGSRSFGEAVLLAEAGGIAYFGGSRVNAGIASQGFQNGNLVVIKQEHMGGMTQQVFASYAAGASDLGHLYTGAVSEFVATNDWEDHLVRRTLFEFVLLGDPAIHIPASVGGEAKQVPVFTPQNADIISNLSVPGYTNSLKKEVETRIVSDSAALTMKLVDTTNVSVVGRFTAPGPYFDYAFSPASGFLLYTVRAEADDGREGWFMVNTSSSLLCIDGDLTDWDTEGIRPVAVDPQGDFDDKEYDVSRLWAYANDDHWYFAFDATCEDDDMSYVLAVDYKDGGFSGRRDLDPDAEGNCVTFDAAFAVDAEIYLKHVTWVPWAGWETFRDCRVYHQFSEADYTWANAPLAGVGGTLSYSPAGDLVELAIPREFFEHASEIRAALFSLPSGGESPAQDSVPSDPSTYQSLTLGKENSNTISRFVEVACRPTNGIRAAGFWDNGVSCSNGGCFMLMAIADQSVTDIVSMEVCLDDMPTGLLLNDEGILGDAAAGDGFWTLSMELEPNALPAGSYLLSIVATNEMGGCAGQWPKLICSACTDLLTPQSTRLTALLANAPTSRAAEGALFTRGKDQNETCQILLAGISNTATSLSELTIEAQALVSPGCAPDAVQVLYSGVALDVELTDDGQGEDFAAGDGIFSGSFVVSRDLIEHRQYALELAPVKNGQTGMAWPYLHVAE